MGGFMKGVHAAYAVPLDKAGDLEKGWRENHRGWGWLFKRVKVVYTLG